LDRNNPDVYAYTRELNGQKILVLLNFKDRPATAHLEGIDLSKAALLLGNYPGEATRSLDLRPYEAAVYSL
ncbi:MAG TPA: alpha-glucosidase C-terminal domain-containing protein, partial [Saprospiraceae bacterium]|nr:alpha-glucosidase C-terminal domain-containing protein [Saprospiraceae bacterium]